MKYFITSFLLLSLTLQVHSQTRAIDSINSLISKAASDTQRINLKLAKAKIAGNENLDSGIVMDLRILEEAKNINYTHGEVRARIDLAGNYNVTGNYDKAKENLDITKDILAHTRDSDALVRMYNIYGTMYSMQNKFDSSHAFFNQSIKVARMRNENYLLSTALQNNAIAFQQESNYSQAIANYQEALKALEHSNDLESEAYVYLNMGITYGDMDEENRAEELYSKAIHIAQKLNLKNVLAYSYANLATLYGSRNDHSNEYEASMKAVVLGKETGDLGIEATCLSRAGIALAEEKKFEKAEKLIRQGIIIADSSRQPYNIFQVYQSMGYLLHMQKKWTLAIPYFEKAFQSLSESDIYISEVRRSYVDLSDCYEKTGNFRKALSAYKIASKISDSIRGKENIKKATELTLNYEFQKSQQKIKDEQQKKNDVAKTRQTALIIGLILSFILAGVAFNGFRNKRKANHLLQEQKQKIESTLSELKSTQSQLIQSEKMASLGELTAGIAHEIQNPLNFVNNFAEVNRELIAELKTEIENGHLGNAKDIADDIDANEEKISRHGKRADTIVKGMLLHSRTGTGQKEPTDINALADEYLRLAYHGVRARDKDFNAKTKTDFDNSIGKIDIIPQDIGRVLLNLYNNAFYAVDEKAKQQHNGYDPAIWVSTRKVRDKVSISVKDNGNGIPPKAIDKIFQPFFTTKPTGQGTGLGLSMSYDIIAANGGEIKVETKVGEGAEFVIQLPVR